MIVEKNNKPPMEAFRELMAATDDLLNNDAKLRQDYYIGRSGIALEHDVCDALNRCAVHTPFEGTIELVSGAAFPDIVASKYYGVEVKSTAKDQWTSTGSSILESTRIPNVEHIFLTFGKLASPVRFLSRPYQDVMSDIAVTHYPRYRIDMRLQSGKTIFDKMGIPYDKLRQMDDPAEAVAAYYRSKLQPGQKLWWAGRGKDAEECAAPPVLRLWTTLNAKEKNYFTIKGYALFPEIFGHGAAKYQRYALWLASDCSVINTNIRDQFSAGGKVHVQTVNGTFQRIPAAFGRMMKNRDLIRETIMSADEKLLCETWNVTQLEDDRIAMWCDFVARYASGNDLMKYKDIWKLLYWVFFR